ncbi:hypothetical protein NQ314_010300 [Rhamnusium bicolor]|uniref:PWWP domain-containing protein n=1 Tax=Rhamnusium bicolor TaxID=1586634 RepID=A0AAV8XSQ1_9CUCU|nr:hypothetical protein NQ314_010300 [Rhamnusium bicolor]
MKKTRNFNVGDKVFAKIKGYPPWPARITAENGKKYNVLFYGTGETGVIKLEDLSYYLKNKEKFQKPLKRKDYVDAFEQIEEAIKEDGGDGDPLPDANDSVLSEGNELERVSRERVEYEDTTPEEPETPSKKTPKLKVSNETGKSKEFEFVPINEGNQSTFERDGFEIVETEDVDEKSEALDFKIQIISEKMLKNNITYTCGAREDYINQVLPVKLPSGIMGGIKLHREWPLKFENEYDRALYDESVAVRVIEEKKKIESGNIAIVSNHQLFIPNIEMSLNGVTECLYLKDIHSKRSRIDRLKIEADLMGIDSKIKHSLGLDKADPVQAISYLELMCNLNFDELMLKKHPHVVDMVRRLRKYVGNTKEWNLSEESLSEFITQAEKIRATAETIYAKFKDMTEAQIYLLCAEPTSRRAFFDHLEEVESEKENSSGVANSESDPVVANGGGGTPAVKS